jgi:hypothetical protein
MGDMSPKYPRTPHLPWSPGGTSDDRRLTDVSSLLNVGLVITENERGSFLVSVQPWGDGKTFAVHVIDRRDGLHFYVDLATDSRFDWFGWVKLVPVFGVQLTADHLLEYNDRLSTIFHKIAMPVQRMSGSSVDRLLDLCEKVSKVAKKKR